MKKQPSESMRQFELRQEVFDNAKGAGISESRAKMLSIIFYNMFYLGAGYPASI